MVSTLEPAVAVRRDKCERIHLGPRQLSGDLVRRERGEAAQAMLLPARDDRANAGVVGHGRACGCERQPAAGALRAAPNRPGRRRSAALAERRLQAGQRAETRGADLRAGPSAREAALRQQQVEHALDATPLGVTQR